MSDEKILGALTLKTYIERIMDCLSKDDGYTERQGRPVANLFLIYNNPERYPYWIMFDNAGGSRFDVFILDKESFPSLMKSLSPNLVYAYCQNGKFTYNRIPTPPDAYGQWELVSTEFNNVLVKTWLAYSEAHAVRHNNSLLEKFGISWDDACELCDQAWEKVLGEMDKSKVNLKYLK